MPMVHQVISLLQQVKQTRYRTCPIARRAREGLIKPRPQLTRLILGMLILTASSAVRARDLQSHRSLRSVCSPAQAKTGCRVDPKISLRSRLPSIVRVIARTQLTQSQGLLPRIQFTIRRLMETSSLYQAVITHSQAEPQIFLAAQAAARYHTRQNHLRILRPNRTSYLKTSA